MRVRLLAILALLALPLVARADDNDDLEHDISQMQQEPSDQSTTDPAALRELVQTIVKQMSEIRELPLKHAVASEVSTRDQIVGYVKSRIQEEEKADQLAGQELALKRLGLIPEKLDMMSFTLQLYGEQVAGYYDPFKAKFFIASWMNAQMQAPIMAHELTHALQDQSFNLKPFLTPIADNSDATMARQAVVEGDASVAMFAWIGRQSGVDMSTQPIGAMLRQSMKNPQFPVFAQAPEYLQESLAFPYASGSDFIVRTRAAGGWKAVDALYADLPKSTEQILHPEKYKGPAKDDPTPIALAGLKLDGFKEVHTDVLGEAILKVMMDGYFDETDAANIAAGWDGDRYRAFQKVGVKGVRGTMIVQRSTWDTAKDAGEYADAWRRLLPKKYEGATRKDDAGGAAFTTVEDGVARVEIHDKDVVVIDGAPDAATAGKAASAAWAAK